MQSAMTCLHKRAAGSPTRRGYLHGLAVLSALAVAATAFVGGQANAQDQDVTELTVWFAREYTVPTQEQLDAFAEVSGIDCKGSDRYVLSLELGAADADSVTAALLRTVLDMGITPRGVATGSSLEEFFLRVTGS